MLLAKVADLMETKGHVRFKLTDKDEGGYCVLGAMYKVSTGEEPTTFPVFEWARSNLPLLKKIALKLEIVNYASWLNSSQQGRLAWDSLIYWSNNTLTLEVLRKLRRAAKEEEAEILENLDFKVEQPVLVDA